MAWEMLITESDLRRLQEAVRLEVGDWVSEAPPLEWWMPELRQARIIAPEDAPADLVTLDSRLELRDIHTKAVETCALVCDAPVDGAEAQVPALTHAGMALLGRRVGDCVGWWADNALQMARIERLLYRPETADPDLLAAVA